MAGDDRRALLDRGRGRRRHDRRAHAPGDQQVGADLAHQPADVARVAGQRAPRADPLAHATAQLERARAQRDHADALGARALGELALRAGKDQSPREATREVEQGALGPAEHAGVSDGQRQHERGD